MRKIILCLHTTLDGFVAGPNGEMNWIKLDEELFDLVGKLTEEADTALYGRVTYQMMNDYWPTAADQENASKHDIEHSNWYNNSKKVVVSRTMKNVGETDKTIVISDDLETEVKKLKSEDGKNILIFGSPSTAHSLMAANLIDEYWLFINPVVLGNGIPLFAKIAQKIDLKAAEPHLFGCGVIGVNYSVV